MNAPYRLVVADHPEDLERQVNNCIRTEGYEPLGPPTPHGRQLVQAMVHKDMAQRMLRRNSLT